MQLIDINKKMPKMFGNIRIGYIVLLVCSAILPSKSAHILGLMPSSFRSMNLFMTNIFIELAQRGHNITVITPITGKESSKLYREIKSDYHDFATLAADGLYSKLPNDNFYVKQLMIRDTLVAMMDKSMNSTTVQDFIRYDNTNFDLVICQEFFQHAFYMFAHKYKAPLVLVHTFGHAHYMHNFLGNALELSYQTHEFIPHFGPMNLWQKTNNVITALWDIIVGTSFIKRHDMLAEKYFSNLTRPLPKIEDLEKNASIVLVNSDFVLDSARPLTPNVVEVGGLQIKKQKALPPQLKDIVDGAKHGVVYFSLGSVAKSIDLPQEKLQIFMKVFSDLKQTVLWKWENETLPGKPSNVYIMKWMPQNDILAHPNVKLFLTHGGLLSSQEAIYHGVPVVGMPLFTDHFKTMAKAKLMGYGEEIRLETLSYEHVFSTIDKVLNDKSYKRRAEELSAIFRDKPQSAMDTAIYWIEYVIRHKGAHHLKPYSVWMDWYEYYLLDVALVLLTVFLVITTLNVVLLNSLRKFICNKKKEKRPKKNKKL